MKVFLYIFTILMAFGCVKSLMNLYNAGLSRKWPEYSATIIESSYKITQAAGDSTGKAYQLIIRYQYMVDGVQYENSNYDFCNQSVDKNRREQLLAEYPVNNDITVRVNPENPASAVIVSGVTYWHYIWTILSFIFLFMLIKALRNW
jgi:hypothetical protein